MSTLKLWSARACPFAHRTRLVLAEKQLNFELIEIDLQHKPAWLSEISVYGKVPALEHEGRRSVRPSSRYGRGKVKSMRRVWEQEWKG